ncbi:transforming growth factor beta receptor type 3 [Poecilia latipinna]|uniref:transforming growth factor beta receptor type 3 n=1 Tax=Poecilia latipinna TaxID=48699 RepID=UPI00072ECC88|nr:PREDICTED: transforming growth factor beta receptor type 3-like [Poecilia latipinna]XP_014903664.1 PREDICTED: transforming growth factor beta receptor type 3-like [Poecilia latipinna]XP_014903665.1 PREDICTED: transforming growth factor beta receptor type 3-like [Poecilia latipinna]
MPSLTKVGFGVFCFVFLWERLRGAEGRCSPADPAGAQHPVRALLERVQAGRGCAAREQGNKETHVIALQRATNSPENMVTVFLKPLNPPSGPLRALHLVLSSILPVSWWLEAELLPPDFPVLVQVSPNSSVQSQNLRLSVQTVPSLPFRLHTLHRWAMKHHGNLSSLVHAKQGNRVYIHLGEDPTLPAVCQLQSSFLFPNYMTSDLQPQTVKGCSYPRGSEASPEVHVIRLRSTGSWIRGSLQGNVTVSLVPPVATSEPHEVILVLSSSVPVTWVITATEIRGHVSVHSSNSVSLPFPPEPNVTMSSRLLSEPSAGSGPLVWATESGYTDIRSYTEAELANRFVIQLAESGTIQERLPVVNCDGGLLSVTVDQQKLKSLSLPAVAMTLRDQRCQAMSNGSHFLLALPIIFCGTEGILQEQPRGVLYKNMLLLWRAQPQSVAAHGENRTFGVHISCFATSPSKSAPDDDNVTLPLIGRFARGARRGPESAPTPHHLLVPVLTSGPALQLRLFVTDSYKRTWTGPCVITADHRVFVEISAKASLTDAVQVESCFVSPQSDPKKSPFWTVISGGCSSDPSVRLVVKAGGDEDEDAYGEEEEDVGREGDKNDRSGRRFSATDDGSPNVGDSEKTQLLRFSFVLRPVYNESMQFVHCSLLLCLPDRAEEETTQEANSCQSGVPIPPLVPGSSRHQCEIRNLSRPMVVTRPISSLVTKLEPTAGERTKSLSPESSRFVLHEGLLMGIVFAAFLVGVSLMGGLWCIYTYTGGHPESFRNAHLTNQTQEGCNNRTPPFLSDQSSSSV